MKSFKQHCIEEGFLDKALAGALTLGAVSAGAVGYRMMNPHQQPTQPTQPTQTTDVQPQVEQTPKVQTETKPQIQQHQFSSEHSKKLYGAIVSAEHRGHVNDPYAYDPDLAIRTRAGKGKSSAFGPLQITRNTARGFMDTKNPYHVAFVQQGSNFLKSNVTHPNYGLGKSGDLGGEEHHASYQAFAEHIMRKKGKEIGVDIDKPLSRQELAKFTQHWRHGISSQNKPESWYSTTINNYYYN